VNRFRTLLILGWLAVAGVTVWAVKVLGLAEGVETFLSDLRHPWRAQFYADLELHLLLFAGWIVWREHSRMRGFAFAAATMLLGALFTLPYLLAASRRPTCAAWSSAPARIRPPRSSPPPSAPPAGAS
jgi:hypothetical protein